LNSEIINSANVMTPSSGPSDTIMNSLPDVDKTGDVINPTSDNLGTIMNSLGNDEVNVLTDTKTALMQGQFSQVYRISLKCPGIVRITSNYAAQYDLYAVKNTQFNSCLDASTIKNQFDKVIHGSNGETVMTLEPGVWCLVVYGNSGSGSYSLRVTETCPSPTQKPTPLPTSTTMPCDVYKTDTRQGFLNQDQAGVYAYSIPSDRRSKIEWTMSSSDLSRGDLTPIIVASTDNPTIDSSSSSESSKFDLYVFKDCNPRNSHCSTRYYSFGPNSRVSIQGPSTGSVYFGSRYRQSDILVLNNDVLMLILPLLAPCVLELVKQCIEDTSSNEDLPLKI
jgi:hypothetical protein